MNFIRKYIYLFSKHIWLLFSIFILQKHRRMKDEALIYYTRIRIHALEKAQINEQNMALVLQLFEIIPFYRICMDKKLFSKNEVDWARRVLFSKDGEVTLEDTNQDQSNNNFNKVLKSRRSVRRYFEKPVEIEKVEKIIQNALWAPSACNRQPWRFIIFSDKKGKELFAKYIQKFLLGVPLGILIIQSKDAYNKIDISYTPFVDCGIVSQNIMLSAQNEGLGSCYVNTGDYELSEAQTEEIKEHFKISDDWIITGLITLGYSKFVPRPPGRKDIESVIMFDNFDERRSYTGKKPKIKSKAGK